MERNKKNQKVKTMKHNDDNIDMKKKKSSLYIIFIN